ncbi:sorting nexin-25-like [Oppia nitens]|uniref:sorting nexin-25-like n=1 Tax=Oppia nitens TaxID=1686743 RepID=UPI0023DCBEDC|nr:sorting nexin-25-like [Oppia nitens]
MKYKTLKLLLYLLTIFPIIITIVIYFANVLLYLFLVIVITLIGLYLGVKSYERQLMDNYQQQYDSNNINTLKLNPKYNSRHNDNKKTFDDPIDNYFKSRTLVSTNVDQLMEEIVDNCLRDFLFVWYKNLVKDCDSDRLSTKIKNEFWEVLANVVIRMRSIDLVKFFTRNAVNRFLKHFQKITVCMNGPKDNQKNVYHLSAHLTEDKELEFIRKLCDFLLTILLPKSYAKSKPLKHLLREILSVQLLNAINLICDPIYLNQKLLDYLKYHKIESEKHQQTYAYAETYEDFIKMINHCCDVEDLKRIRFQVITEIMEATVINNLKKERGIDMNEKMFSGPITSAKGDLLQARNLKRYINQLTFAKNQCEKRINAINGINNREVLTRKNVLFSSDSLPQPNRKTVLGFKVIMTSEICRSYLKKFMQYSLISSSSTPESRRHLIVFWESVDQLSKQEISKQYEIANEILNNPNFKYNFIKLINLSKNTLKTMEEFVLGNRGPEAYFTAQTMVYEILENRYYPLFIVSKEYNEMLDQMHETLQSSRESTQQSDESQTDESDSELDYLREQSLVDISNSIVEIHVSQTKVILENLSQKLNDKRNALKALKKSETEKLTTNSLNVNQKLIQLLEKEIDDIMRECSQYESHLVCTELWIKGMGHWRAEIHNIEMDNIDGYYLAIIIVYRNDVKESSSNGWIVARNVQQFHELKRKLIHYFPNLKRYDLPKFYKRFISLNETHLNVMKKKLQMFLDVLTTNDKIYSSEELFLFLSQSADSVRKPINRQHNTSTIRSKMFPLAKLFGIASQPYERHLSSDSNSEDVDHHQQQISDNQFLILNDLENEDNIKDDIAESLYDLISEIFELKTITKWLRRSLMTFVQMTYGQTINKQLYSTAEWLASESMIYYYLTSFRDSLWPNGKLSEPWPHNSLEERKRVQILAKQHLLNSIPEVFNNLLGQQNVRKGVVKAFDGLQNQLLNKQLFYEIVETFIFEFAPELKSY